MSLFKRKKNQPQRYDIHRTIAHPTPEYTVHPGEIVEEPKKKRFFTWKKAILLLFLIILTPLLVIGFLDARNFSRASEKLFGSGNLLQMVSSGPLQATEQGRVNMLLIGYSADDPGHAGAMLTDSIMVLSLDKKTNTGYMLSIPRDLYVDIPEYGHAKINEAFQDGERGEFIEPGYSPGGPGLLQKIIVDNFGIPIHYYAIINYGAVRDMVSALDGITVTINSTDPRGLYDPNFQPREGGPLKLANGPQQLDAQTALNLTRARGATAGSYGFPRSDFNRSEHQRQVMAAIKDKINWEIILDPRKNAKLFDAAANNIKTNLRIDEALPFYRIYNKIPSASLQPVGLNDIGGVDLLRSYQTPTGQSALIPAAGVDDYSQILKVMEELNK